MFNYTIKIVELKRQNIYLHIRIQSMTITYCSTLLFIISTKFIVFFFILQE